MRKTMSHRTTLLINPYTGELKCKICGNTFYSSVKPIVGEIYYNTEFSCPNGCNVNPASRTSLNSDIRKGGSRAAIICPFPLSHDRHLPKPDIPDPFRMRVRLLVTKAGRNVPTRASVTCFGMDDSSAVCLKRDD